MRSLSCYLLCQYSLLFVPSQALSLHDAVTRRQAWTHAGVFVTTTATLPLQQQQGAAWAFETVDPDTDDEKTNDGASALLQGRVSLQNDAFIPQASGGEEGSDPAPSSALYVTCRPDRPDNVPRAILDGSRGKPPPVLSKRVENPTFPVEVVFGEADVTVEGSKEGADDTYWWQTSSNGQSLSPTLIVSARWDDDGVAATRSPNDLVGRTLSAATGEPFALELGSRGAFGGLQPKSNKIIWAACRLGLLPKRFCSEKEEDGQGRFLIDRAYAATD